VAHLYVLRHVEHGAISTFTTLEEAEHELAWVLEDEPSWTGDVWIEPFNFTVAAETR
jgi:hypothetical protein